MYSVEEARVTQIRVTIYRKLVFIVVFIASELVPDPSRIILLMHTLRPLREEKIR